LKVIVRPVTSNSSAVFDLGPSIVSVHGGNVAGGKSVVATEDVEEELILIQAEPRALSQDPVVDILSAWRCRQTSSVSVEILKIRNGTGKLGEVNVRF